MSLGHHICFRAKDDRVLTPSDDARRRLARAVNRIAGPEGLLAFRTADTHGHVESLCDRERGGELTRRLEIALTKQLRVDCGLYMSSITPIETHHHLRNTFLYVLRQHSRHGLQSDPYHEASSVPDLLGARMGCEGLIARVREHLPRIRRRELLEIAGVSQPLERVALDPAYLPAAAAAATGLAELSGRLPRALLARVAVVKLASEQLSCVEIAALLGTTERAVRRLRHLAAPAEMLTVIRVQAALRQAIDIGSRVVADAARGT